MVKNAALIAASLLVGLVLCELVLRVAVPDLLPRPDLYLLDPVVGKRMKPNHSTSEFGAPVVTNSHGLRSPELGFEKPAATVRVLALGDSWTFGYRVPEPDSYPRQLERELASRARERGDGRRFEVINAGVIGYSTEQEAAYLREWGWRYAPDLVVVAYYPVNDTHMKNRRYERYNRLRAVHPLLLELTTFPQKLYLRQFWKGMRRLARREIAELRLALAGRLGYQDPGARGVVEDDWTGDFVEERPGWHSSRDALVDIGRQCREHGVPGLVVLLPDLLDLARYEDRLHERVAPKVETAAREAGLAWLDLRATFSTYRGREREVRTVDQRHPNAAGFGVIADAVASEIERAGLLAAPARLTRRVPMGRAGDGGGKRTEMVEMSGLEPPTSALRRQRSPS